MKDQVLTIEQMNILISKGVDVSKASVYWVRRIGGWDIENKSVGKWSLSFHKDFVTSGFTRYETASTFTVADLMEMLPHKIKINDKVCELVANKGSLSKGWYVCYSESASVLEAEMMNCDRSLITALLEMATWVLDNGYKLSN